MPAIIVIVEEKGRETLDRFGHSGLFGDIHELPTIRLRIFLVARTIVAEKNIGLTLARNVEVRTSVVIEVSPRNAFDKAEIFKLAAPTSVKVPSWLL
jgi:hypothetical protein